jgi:hypothetical protein
MRSSFQLASSVGASLFGANNTRTVIDAYDLTYSPQRNRFVCCGINGVIPSSSSKAQILIIDPDNEENLNTASDFTNGVNSVTLSTTTWSGITWAAELGYFVTVANADIVSSIAYSLDGFSWKFAANPDTGGDHVPRLRSVGWGSKTGFLAVGQFSDNGQGICLLRTRRYPDPGTTLVDTVVQTSSNGTTSANLVFGQAPFYTPIGRAPLFMVRAWATFNGRVSNGLASYGNIKSYTRKAVGVYEFSFLVPMHTDTYAIMVTGPSHADIRNPGSYTPSSTGGLMPSISKFRISTRTTFDNPRDYEYVCVMVIC